MAGQLHGFGLEDDKPVEREGEKGKPKTPGKIEYFCRKQKSIAGLLWGWTAMMPKPSRITRSKRGKILAARLT
jgi:hypothetical protein